MKKNSTRGLFTFFLILLASSGMNIYAQSLPRQSPVIGKTQDKVPRAAGTAFLIPRIAIPSIVLSDAPAGLNSAPLRTGDSTKAYYATAWPFATLLASSWDTALVSSSFTKIGFGKPLTVARDTVIENKVLMPQTNLNEFKKQGAGETDFIDELSNFSTVGR